MILAVALLNKTIAKSSHYYWSPLVSYWFMVKKGRRGNCPLFNEVWPRRALCLYFCVLLCECVSDAANCPFAVYPMGSGMSLVTACSFSLNGPVAMAALQRPAPPQCTESDRPIRAGCCDMMQSAVITALRRQDFWGGDHTPAKSQQDSSPNKHIEPRPLEVMSALKTPHPHLSITCGTCHQTQWAVIPTERRVQTTTPRGL